MKLPTLNTGPHAACGMSCMAPGCDDIICLADRANAGSTLAATRLDTILETGIATILTNAYASA